MLYDIIRPLLFRVEAERAHGLAITALKLFGGGQAEHPDGLLSTEVAGIRFPNPVGMAAGFDKNAAIAVATTLLQQAKVDNVNIFKLLDTLKGYNELQLSSIVTEVLNYSRAKSSTLGYKRTESADKTEKRNIVS